MRVSGISTLTRDMGWVISLIPMEVSIWDAGKMI